MTLTSSRINDEFKLIQEIIALCPGIGQPFNLYSMTLTMLSDFGGATLCLVNERGNQVALPLRHAVKYILRRYW